MSLLIARQGDNRTINDFKAMYDYATDPFKTKDKNFVYTFGSVTDDPFAEMVAPIYEDGFHCTVSMHFDTGKRHFHILRNCVSFVDGHKFSQSISQLNRFKLYVNKALSGRIM